MLTTSTLQNQEKRENNVCSLLNLPWCKYKLYRSREVFKYLLHRYFYNAIITLQVTALVQSQPQYEVQLELPVGFFYRSGFLSQLADGTCCSPNETACHTSCNQTQITLCFRETSNNTDMNNCTLGEMTFITGAGSGIYTFSATGATTTTTYPVSVAGVYNYL